MRSACFAPENDSIHPSTHWQHNADLCARTSVLLKVISMKRLLSGLARACVSVHDLNMRVTQLSIVGQFFRQYLSFFLNQFF